MRSLLVLGALLVSASPTFAQAPGRELPEEYKSDNWVVVSEGQNPVQKKQYEMALIDKSSFKNTSGSRWNFDIVFLQWDTYANPNHYALTGNSGAGGDSGHWIDCSKGMYVLDWIVPGDETYIEKYYSPPGAWLEKDKFETGRYVHDEAEWNEFGRLNDNRKTRIFNLICGTSFKTR